MPRRAYIGCKCTQKKEIFQLFLLSLSAELLNHVGRMNKLASLWTFVRRHKYLLALCIFGVIIVFLDENSIIRRLSYTREEMLLREEISKYRSEYEENTKRLNELQADSSAIERIAREKYLMKKPNEDIFVFEDDIE